MAKHCELCRKPYPDNQTVCPHCGHEEGTEDIVQLADPEPSAGDSDVVSLIEPSKSSSGSGSDIVPVESGSGLDLASLEEEAPPSSMKIPQSALDEELPPALAGKSGKPSVPAKPKTMLASQEDLEEGDLPPSSGKPGVPS